MGCFSYLCAECGDPINSNSFSGEHAILFLLDKGEIREWMQGEYDSYGRVFTSASARDQRPGDGEDGFASPASPAVGALKSFEWETIDWGTIVDMHFGTDSTSGIAAYHTECWHHSDGTPEVSDDDPEQGWREYAHPVKGPDPRHVKGDTRVTWAEPEKP